MLFEANGGRVTALIVPGSLAIVSPVRVDRLVGLEDAVRDEQCRGEEPDNNDHQSCEDLVESHDRLFVRHRIPRRR